MIDIDLNMNDEGIMKILQLYFTRLFKKNKKKSESNSNQ